MAKSSYYSSQIITENTKYNKVYPRKLYTNHSSVIRSTNYSRFIPKISNFNLDSAMLSSTQNNLNLQEWHPNIDQIQFDPFKQKHPSSVFTLSKDVSDKNNKNSLKI